MADVPFLPFNGSQLRAVLAELAAETAGSVTQADFDALALRVAALEAGSPPVGESMIYRKPADFDEADLRMNVNPTGPYTLTEAALVEWNADGTATLHAEERPDEPGYNGLTYYTGSLVTRTPVAFNKGRFGAIVFFVGRSVGALFAYGDGGREIDFELTYLLGEAGYSPNLWLRPQGGGSRVSAGIYSGRVFRRAPLHTGPMRLEADMRDDRCDFYYQNLNADLSPAGPMILFETITPADFPATINWDVTTNDYKIFLVIEKHDGWAGWSAADYALPAEMKVYSLTPTAYEIEASDGPLEFVEPTVDPTARVINGLNWTFTQSGGARAGVMPDGNIGLSKAQDLTGTDTAVVTIPTTAGVPHHLHFSIRGKDISVNGAGSGWAGYSAGNHTRTWTPATSGSITATFTSNFATLSHLGDVRLTTG